MGTFIKTAVLSVSILITSAIVARSADPEGPSLSTTTNSLPQPKAPLELVKPSIWDRAVGDGFRPTVEDLAVEAGVASGVTIFGSRQAHDLALLSLSYGHMLGYVRGEDHWYRGNVEARLELFGGGQYAPSVDWLIGLTPHLRYNFATGTRWIPFVDAGAGVTATGIGPPDLSGTFEFNLQATAGVHWFFRDDLALTGDVRYMHFSCGGLHHPNLGANDVAFMVGLSWFFGK